MPSPARFHAADVSADRQAQGGAVEIRLLASGAATGVLLDLLPEFERSTGHRVTAAHASSNRILARIREGESADVVILNGPGLDELAAQGRIVSGSRVEFARTGLGIAVRRGAVKPDIGSVEALKRTLLNARSIARTATGASGVYFAGLIERLGLAEALAPRIKVIAGGLVGEIVARGEVELGVQMVSEILAVPGAELVGPLPPEVQSVTILGAAVFAGTQQLEAAQALVQFLASSAAAHAMQAKGLEPLA
jgi:molybdate transport system substrate-binding protein